MTTYGDHLSSSWRNQLFQFYSRTLQGINSTLPRWEVCVQQIDNSLGELLGKQFVELAFPAKSDSDARLLINGILLSMNNTIASLTWMDNITRELDLNKLKQVEYLVGGPLNPRDYEDVGLSSNYFNNVLNATSVAIRRDLSTIGGPKDAGRWYMTAPTVNAYYSPTENQMVFPAGILQIPYFDYTFPVSMNAGGIGMIMGHELTHGFDNSGRLYTGTGLLENWWQNETNNRFLQKAECVINQYNNFTISGVNLNGKLTEGENIADMGGIKLTYNAFSKLIGAGSLNLPSIVPTLSRAQLLFVAFSQGWCSKTTDEYIKLRIHTDPHSPAKFRVLGPLMNLPYFSDVFSCARNTTMNPIKRCEVW